VSSLQSQLFNQWLTARMADGLYAKPLLGDILHKTTGGQFVCEDPSVDEPRLIAGEIGITGPMFGDRMRRATEGSPAAARETAILDAAGLTVDSFAAVRAIAEGTRRDATITVGEPTVRGIASSGSAGARSNADALPSEIDDGVEVSFSLPGGAYATAVMRELMKSG
jgi:tRNA pseudouridine13 synthase